MRRILFAYVAQETKGDEVNPQEYELQSWLHCWESSQDGICMLPREHEGPCVFTPESEILITFEDEEENQ